MRGDLYSPGQAKPLQKVMSLTLLKGLNEDVKSPVKSVLVAVSSLARILGECSTFIPRLRFFFFFFGGASDQLAHTNSTL